VPYLFIYKHSVMVSDYGHKNKAIASVSWPLRVLMAENESNDQAIRVRSADPETNSLRSMLAARHFTKPFLKYLLTDKVIQCARK